MTPRKLKALSERCIDAPLVVKRLICVPLFEHDDGTVSEPLSDALDDIWQGRPDEVFPNLPARFLKAADGRHWRDLVLDWMHMTCKRGWLVEVASPVRRKREHGVCTFSWSSTYVRWLYADTLEAALEAGLAWAADLEARDMQ